MNYSRYNLTIDQALKINQDEEIPVNSDIKKEAIGVLSAFQESIYRKSKNIKWE